MLNLKARLGSHPLARWILRHTGRRKDQAASSPDLHPQWQIPVMRLRLPHVDFRLPQGPVRLPNLGVKFPQVEFRLPHLNLPHVTLPQVHLPHMNLSLGDLKQVDLRHLDLRHLDLNQIAELERALAIPPSRDEGRRKRWLRYAAGSLTVLALVLGFQALDRTVSRWFAASEPIGAWEGEAAEWYQLYADGAPVAVSEDLTAGAPTPVPVEQASLVSGTRTERSSSGRRHHPDAEQRFVRVSVTAYTSAEGQTDESPTITASNTRVSERTVAVSRDLLRSFTPGAPFDYGDKILIPGVGIYRVEDTMNGRWRRKIDLWFATKDEARRWGVRTAYIAKVEESAPTVAFRDAQ